MKLGELLRGVPYRGRSEWEELEIAGVTCDSRKVVPGGLFVCLRGEKADGRDFIPQAIQAGAAAVLMEQEAGDGCDFPREEAVLTAMAAEGRGIAILTVPDAREALALVSAAWFGHPAEHMQLIGITGTKGKTTTAHMLRAILEEAGCKTGMIGTMGAFVEGDSFPVDNTTPEPCELHRLLAEMRRRGCSHVVMEVSSQALKQKRTAGLRFAYGVFLNISPDHIGPGEHADFAEYLACKKRLFLQTDRAVVNLAAGYGLEAAPGARDRILFSVEGAGDYCGSRLERIWQPGLLGVRFHFSGRAEGSAVLNMPGRFNVENALAAISVAADMGIPVPVITRALAAVTVKGRTQILGQTAHFSTILIDYAHNALSMESLLRTLREYEPERLLCLFGGGGNKPKQRRYDMGLAAGKYADLTILTMDNPRFEPMEEINREIIRGLNVYGGNYLVIDDREEAIHYLIDHCGKGDIAALIGKGHEEYQEVRGIRYPFSEEAVVNRYLETK